MYDCNTAGHILQAFNKFATQRDEEHAIAVANGGPTAAGTEATGAQSMERQTGLTSVSQQSQQPPAGKGALDPHSRSASQASLGPAPPYVPFRDCIQLASCRPNELLPMTPDLPADLFTCCLTTPIEIALRWFVSQNLLVKNITNEMILKIPGKLNDRRTPLGELNWIFTAITDTIAWNSLSHELFQKLFRQDLMVAALFRNFLLAERIMRHYGCHPLSMPVLPKTFQHPMWEAWDLAVDVCLTQLPLLLRAEETKTTYEYRHSTFFAEQLTAFEVGLSRVGISRKAPDQLPIVLQVLLSQVHRLRALMLLSRFLDLGPWAVNQALSVGIFPYVLKLLQSPALELKPVLVFIWCKILAVDRSCQGDLLKDEGFTYFVNILAIENADVLPHMPNISEHRAMCAFILANFCRGFPSGQIACYKADLLGSILPHLSDADPLLRQWACLCLATFWDANVEIKRIIVNESIHEQLFVLLSDPVPEVRSAAISALNTLLGSLEKTDSVVFFDHSVIMSVLEATLNDASPLVRTETIVILSRFVAQYPSKMTAVATELLEEERQRGGQSRIGRKSDSRPQSMPPNTDVEIHTVTSERSLWNDSSSSIKSSRGSKPVLLSTLYGIVWKTLLNMSVDPFPTVSNLASQVVDKVMMRVLTLSGLVNSTALSINSLNITPILANLELPSTRQNTLPSRVKSNSMQNLSSLAAGPAPARQSSSNGSKDSHTGSSTVGKISHTLGRSASIVFSSLFGPSAPVPASPVESLSDTRLASESRAILARAGSLKYRSNVSSQPASKPHSDLAQDRTYVADKDRLALESFLFEWSLEYFTEPQMKVPDSEDPGTQRYNQRLWRALRNERVTQETAKMKDLTGFQEVAPGGLHDELHPPVKALFHTFDPHLLSVDPFSRMWLVFSFRA